LRVNSFFGFMLSCIVGGTGSCVFVITSYSLYYRHLNLKHRGKKIGSFLFGAYGGFAFGPFLAGILQKYWPMQSVFWSGLFYCQFYSG